MHSPIAVIATCMRNFQSRNLTIVLDGYEREEMVSMDELLGRGKRRKCFAMLLLVRVRIRPPFGLRCAPMMKKNRENRRRGKVEHTRHSDPPRSINHFTTSGETIAS